ncbi:MAG: NAD-dependent epimerase/dehydratase family protein [Actinomycetota bacterium]
MPLPDRLVDIEHLEDVMTTPTEALIDDLATVDGDIVVLGVGGKMGPTLARMAKRAAPGKRIIGVARFSESGVREGLDAVGVETIACDLLDPVAVASLPSVENVVFMAGRKFGTSGREDLTWAMNTHVPTIVAQAYATSRIVAFSTGCVYPYWPIDADGPNETVAPVAPPGEYANSCVGRERMFEYFSNVHGTPGRIIRLNYAIDCRYGVLRDVADKVWRGEEIDLTMGHVNVIWQGDANAMALRALRHCTTPTSPLNITGPGVVSIRSLAEAFGDRFERPPVLTGSEASHAWLNDAGAALELFGPPEVGLETMVDWVAAWVADGGPSLDKPTHYEQRDGSY